jgi:hypothetical protein
MRIYEAVQCEEGLGQAWQGLVGLGMVRPGLARQTHCPFNGGQKFAWRGVARRGKARSGLARLGEAG